MVTARRGSGKEAQCRVDASALVAAQCEMPEPGAWHVSIYTNEEKYGQYDYVAGVDVNNR
jgi:hypothetical protein